MLRKGLCAALILLLAVGYLMVYNGFERIPLTSVSLPAVKRAEPEPSPYKQAEAELYRFVSRNLLCKNGEILTNTKPGKDGPRTLSESVGLLMRYSLMKDRKDLFDLEYRYLTDELMVKHTFVRWESGAAVTSNALIDDFRITRDLLDGYEKWGNEEYFNTAAAIQDGILKYQVSSGHLLQFYEWKYGTRKESVPLCYLDLPGMKQLVYFDHDWEMLWEKSRDLIQESSISRSCPFFFKSYDYAAGRYLRDEEYAQKKGINLTYTLITAAVLAQAGEDTGILHNWLKKEMGKGRLFAWYSPSTLKPAQDIESTAVYALAAMYSLEQGDRDLAKKLLDRMLAFRVKEQKSPYAGGFGNAAAGEFYSFDNLMALLALALYPA